MPQSLAIGSFVLGAVLLLISVVGGRFKLFGAEVAGSAGPIARIFAGLFGLVLLAAGFGSELAKPAAAGPDAPPGGAQFLPSEPTDSARPAPPAAGPPPVKTQPAAEPVSEPEAAPSARGHAGVSAAVAAALDAATQAMNQRSPAPLDRHFEAGARMLVAGVAQGAPPLVRAFGFEVAAAIEGLEFEAVDLADDGQYAQASFHFYVGYRTTGYGQCTKLLEGPVYTTYQLRWAGGAWRVYQIVGRNPTPAPVQQVPC